MRRRMVAGAAVAAVLGLSGCSPTRGLYGVNLPGGASLGSHPYTVTAQFADALDLVPQSSVKVNDVPVGRVTKISLEPNGKIADVAMQVNDDVQLPANAVASIQQTSLLGEKYVALAPPSTAPPTGRLTNGATIALARTDNGVEVEQVLGALSLLLNDGGIGQLQTIDTQLNVAVRGHGPAFRAYLKNLTKVVASVNQHKGAIITALHGLNRLAGTLRKQNAEIASALDTFTPGLKVLAQQRHQIVQTVNALGRLSTVTVRTVEASKNNAVTDLRELAPVLRDLASAGSALPHSLQLLATYPFTDGALSDIKGDYLNAFVKVQLKTPGGHVIRLHPHGNANGHARRAPDASATLPPSGLLPPTSQAAAGMPSTLRVAASGPSGGGR